MKPTVYLETTIVSYLTAHPTRDVVIAALIEQTKKWWEEERSRFELFVSSVVVREASAGDADAARRRLAVLQSLETFEPDTEADALAGMFLRNLVMPPTAADDALHVAIAATRQMDYLLTWNCRHIANATARPKLEGLCLAAGYRCPIICTPPELMSVSYENRPDS